MVGHGAERGALWRNTPLQNWNGGQLDEVPPTYGVGLINRPDKIARKINRLPKKILACFRRLQLHARSPTRLSLGEVAASGLEMHDGGGLDILGLGIAHGRGDMVADPIGRAAQRVRVEVRIAFRRGCLGVP
jgi:hypothetical protein